MSPSAALESSYSRLEEILSKNLLPGRRFSNPGMKVIHDPLWGSRLFYPWEIALLDTPLCQRLRRVYQLGTAYLTYPSAVHTRFSHTLGVTVLAGRLVTRIKEKAEIAGLKIPIMPRDIYTVRTAGLLHDIGHCFFSHASEKVLDSILKPLMKECNLGHAKPHEFIAYLILTSAYFKEYWSKLIVPLFLRAEDAPDPESMAKIIVQVPPSNQERYLQEIISGPYDVDKLEYLYRDARTAGLEISYDIERYFYKITLANGQDGTHRLAMDQGGISAVEQMIFSKMMLYSFVYHHQKVLASDLIITDMLMELLENKAQGHIVVEHPLDFLRYTDYDILSSFLEGPSERFKKLREMILCRRLPKRCFVMKNECVIGVKTDLDVKRSWDSLKNNLRALPDDVASIRKAIVARMKEKAGKKGLSEEITIDDLYVVFPKVPGIEEAAHAPVVDMNGKLSPMGEYFDLEGWQKTYDIKKLKGYFYASEHFRELASEAIEEYLREEFKLSFEENSRTEAKISPNTCKS
jgi:uncharacterized protein